MGWHNSNRRGALPQDWRARRARILARDHHRCTIAGPHCTGTATEVDHIGERTDHRDHMLRAVCHPCHARRTAQQAASSRTARRRRPDEGVPGLLSP